MSGEFCVYTKSRRCTKDDIVVEGDAVTISGSVGRGGANRPDDVRTIQQAINDVSLDEGGPLLALSVDGIVGRRTIEAIERFQHRQLGWSDGRVDTNKQTIAALNRVMGGGGDAPVTLFGGGVAMAAGAKKSAPKPKPTPPNVDPNPYIPMMVGTMMPDVLACIHAAQTNLLSVRLALMHPQNTSSPWLNAEKLASPLRVFFNIRHARNVLGSIDHILQIFSTMARALARGVGESHFEADVANRDYGVAYTKAGGYFQGGKRDKGAKFGPRNDTIYICPAWLAYAYPWQLLIILHELAHFCGPKNGPWLIEDIAYLDDGPKYFNLKHGEALRNAESYAGYAHYCRYGRAPTPTIAKPEFL